MEQVFNTNPNYCCNLIYSCISYGCATLNGGVLLTHRLIFSCPHYRSLPSALFLPACIRTHTSPPAETGRPTKEGQHCSKRVPCSPTGLRRGWPPSGSTHLDRSKITGHQDMRLQTRLMEARRGCSSLLSSIRSRIYQWQRSYKSGQGLNHSTTVKVFPTPIHNSCISSTATPQHLRRSRHPPHQHNPSFIPRVKKEARAPASEERCHLKIPAASADSSCGGFPAQAELLHSRFHLRSGECFHTNKNVGVRNPAHPLPCYWRDFGVGAMFPPTHGACCIFNQQLGKSKQKPAKLRALSFHQPWKMPGMLVMAPREAALHCPLMLRPVALTQGH